MPLYESTFIARPDLSRQDVTRLTEAFTGIIEQQKGKIVKNEYWGLRNLAYPIQKNRKGHYTMLGLDASPEAMREMERNMRINEDIVRLLTVRVDALTEEASPIMQQRLSREEGYEGFAEREGGDAPAAAATAEAAPQTQAQDAPQ